jgi:hypothetical protein
MPSFNTCRDLGVERGFTRFLGGLISLVDYFHSNRTRPARVTAMDISGAYFCGWQAHPVGEKRGGAHWIMEAASLSGYTNVSFSGKLAVH